MNIMGFPLMCKLVQRIKSPGVDKCLMYLHLFVCNQTFLNQSLKVFSATEIKSSNNCRSYQCQLELGDL